MDCPGSMALVFKGEHSFSSFFSHIFDLFVLSVILNAPAAFKVDPFVEVWIFQSPQACMSWGIR